MIIVTIVASIATILINHPQPFLSSIILLLIIRSSNIGSKSTQLRKTSSHPKVNNVHHLMVWVGGLGTPE